SAEIGISRDLAKEFGIEFKSFVFPRNEVGHVDLLKEFGFRVYRGAGDWRWNMSQRLLTRRINAAKDWALPLLTTPTYQGGIWEVPTHFHFTSLLPWDGKLPVISLLGVCRGIRKAVRERRVFTVYFHPWELLLCPSHGKGFQTLLRYASKMRDKGKLSIITMGELPTILDRRI
ncbi:MAG: hypothetical protein KAW09_06755, partial [Thermoplasmata archaeon]|nr:hypothetical protein [Thermoplasmata archaeon]